MSELNLTKPSGAERSASGSSCGCLEQLGGLPAGRRRFLGLLGLGGAALLTGTAIPRAVSWAAGGTDALLLNCMDYRLTAATTRYMTDQGMAGLYDQVILAGASLGARTDKFPAWRTTFWEHLKVAIDLHHIHEVVVIDHRDCGAYKVILGEDFAKDPVKEFAVHAEQLRGLRAEIRKTYPALEVRLGLMALDGKVEKVG
jgi:hypothetical protein